MFIKKCYAFLLKALCLFLGNHVAKIFDVGFRFHRKINLKTPITLADKVSWLSLNEYSSLESQCTDKWEVRKYVQEKGLENILVPLVGGPWDQVDAVSFEELPSSFMLKATHGCKMGYPVEDKSKLNISDCREKMQSWLDVTYGTYSMELHYLQIPHRLYAEELLQNGEELIDYKFHCLNGKPQFILVCSNRKLDEKNRMSVTLDLFDINWKPIFEVIPFKSEVPGKGDVLKPRLLDEMLDIAKKLSEDFKFCRVDLYEYQGKVMFGELTFTPACGAFPNFTTEFLLAMGKLLQI